MKYLEVKQDCDKIIVFSFHESFSMSSWIFGCLKLPEVTSNKAAQISFLLFLARKMPFL
jgi:hypothetical protein